MLEKIKIIRNCIKQSNLESTFKSESPEIWKSLEKELQYIQYELSSDYIEYKICFEENQDNPLDDISLILYHNNKPCGLWLLTLNRNSKSPIDSNGGKIIPPKFINDCNLKIRKKILSTCISFLNLSVKELKGKYWQSTERYDGQSQISIWYKKAISNGAIPEIKHDIILDLTKSPDDIKSGIRKSYKHLIQLGNRHLNCSIMDTGDKKIWEEFRMLHYEEAEKKTRSDETWELQRISIERKNSFLICARNERNILIGGGYFVTSKDEAFYAVGAYKKKEGYAGVGHVVQYSAIEEMKKRKLKYYYAGQRIYPYNNNELNNKLITISEFKEGFGAEVFINKCLLNNI